MTHVILGAVGKGFSDETELSWMQYNPHAVTIVEKALHRRAPQIRNDEDQTKIRDVAQLLQKQIGRMAVGRDRDKVCQIMSTMNLDELRRKRRSSGFELSRTFAIMPEVLHPLLVKIKDDLVVDADMPFMIHVQEALITLLELVPPITRTYRQSWMHLIGGVPPPSHEIGSKNIYKHWVTNTRDMLLTLLNSEREADHHLAAFFVQLFEVDLAAQYILASNRKTDFKGKRDVEPPGKKKKANKEFVTVFSTKKEDKENEIVEDETDELGYNNRIPSLLPMALVTLRPTSGECRRTTPETSFFVQLCEGFFRIHEECIDNTITLPQKLFGRLLVVCMDAIAVYGTLTTKKVSRLEATSIKSFDDISEDNKPVVISYIRTIAEYSSFALQFCLKRSILLVNTKETGPGIVQRLVPVGWLRQEILYLQM
uniref:TIMELESS domain-containing protein n=1 Tax=Steinernema glaseri TaxID=37863 RepID=A0A1I7YBV2_9BILA